MPRTNSPQFSFDLDAMMPRKSEDDIATERILMAEMVENPAPPPAWLDRQRDKMIAEKAARFDRYTRNRDLAWRKLKIGDKPWKTCR